MGAPFLILLTAEYCPSCKIFAPNHKIKAQLPVNFVSDWDRILNDVEITSKFHIRLFEIGMIDGVVRNRPDQFSYVENVPTVIICKYEDYTKCFSVCDDEDDVVVSYETVPGITKGIPLSYDIVRAWALENQKGI